MIFEFVLICMSVSFIWYLMENFIVFDVESFLYFQAWIEEFIVSDTYLLWFDKILLQTISNPTSSFPFPKENVQILIKTYHQKNRNTYPLINFCLLKNLLLIVTYCNLFFFKSKESLRWLYAFLCLVYYVLL